MSGEHGSEESQETGGGLRAQLEAAIAEKAAAERALAETIAGNFQHVKAEDLSGVPRSELAAKAAEIENQRKVEQETLVQSALKARGLTDDQIAELLAGSGAPAPSSQPAPQGAPEILGRIQGTPPSAKPDTEGLVGPQRIRAALG
jgi:hypothetical protein